MLITNEVRIEELIEEIKTKRKDKLASKIERWKRNNPILSDISDCDRQMVYGVLNWEDKPLHDEELQARFEEGKEQERKVITELLNMGFEVILSQQPVVVKGKDNVTLATGRIDGFVKYKGRKFPLEVKSMNPNVYSRIDSVEDFEKKSWLRKYTRQLQMYLFGNNEEQGFFIVTDCLGHWKLFPIFLDFGICELILQRLERDYIHIKNKTLPDRISYSNEMCGKCPFSIICLSDIVNEGLPLIDNDDLELKLLEREQLKPAVERYIEIDEESKELAKKVGKDFIVNESFKVEVKKSESLRINTKLIPIEERSKYEVKSEMIKVNFIPLGEKK